MSHLLLLSNICTIAFLKDSFKSSTLTRVAWDAVKYVIFPQNLVDQ